MIEKNILLSDIRERMFHEMADKTIFNQVKDYAFEYADNSLNRNVFPTTEALEELKAFDEDLPVKPNQAEEVLAQLHKYGSPATVMQSGGRYFGFVIGGSIPTALAARWLSDFWDQNAVAVALNGRTGK